MEGALPRFDTSRNELSPGGHTGLPPGLAVPALAETMIQVCSLRAAGRNHPVETAAFPGAGVYHGFQVLGWSRDDVRHFLPGATGELVGCLDGVGQVFGEEKKS